MEEPPSVLDVEVFDFEGPFDHATSLGHAEINFVKHTSSELADIWVPLEGKLAQSSQSKLHLRVFLDNNKGVFEQDGKGSWKEGKHLVHIIFE